MRDQPAHLGRAGEADLADHRAGEQVVADLVGVAIDELRDLLPLQREIHAHKRAPKQYEPPVSEYLMEGPNNVALALSRDSDPWPHIDRTRRDAARVVEAGRRFGLGQDDDKKGYKVGQDFFPALIDRMHLTAVLAKCGEFCARAEAFVKNTISQLRGLDQSAMLDQDKLWPENARPAVFGAAQYARQSSIARDTRCASGR